MYFSPEFTPKRNNLIIHKLEQHKLFCFQRFELNVIKQTSYLTSRKIGFFVYKNYTADLYNWAMLLLGCFSYNFFKFNSSR